MKGQQNLRTAISQALRWRTGYEFQTTAQGILRHCIPGFERVEPYGNKGDGGNDGYARVSGTYAQIYAPSSQNASMAAAVRKATTDFEHVLEDWDDLSEVREYLFVTNALGTNIPVETALIGLQKKHGVKARHFGLDELADAVMKLSSSDIEDLLGITVVEPDVTVNGKQKAFSLLSSIDPPQLEALHYLTALAYPIVPELMDGLFRKVIKWKDFLPSLVKRGWAEKDGHLFSLSDEVSSACRENDSLQKRVSEKLVKGLKAYGSVDCLFLCIRPLLTLSRLKEAARLISHVGTNMAGDGWDEAFLSVHEVFDTPKLLNQLTSSERLAFRFAKANLLSAVGREREAFALFQDVVEIKAPWPRGVSRSLMLLNFGVAAHHSDEPAVAAELYERSIKLARKSNDAWVLGRAASNLAQSVLSEDPQRATLLIEESDAAKQRCGDDLGGVTTAMVRGLIAAELNDHEGATSLFEAAKKRALKLDAPQRVEISFNLATSYGEEDMWKEAAKEFGFALRLAKNAEDDYRIVRCQGGLAEATFNCKAWKACEAQCEALSNLPEDTPHVDFRLTGLHGLVVLALRSKSRSEISAVSRSALAYARKKGAEHWIGRLLVDPVIGESRHPPGEKQLNGLLKEGKAEEKAKRFDSADIVYKSIWQLCIDRQGEFSEIATQARDALDRLSLKENDVGKSISLLKWQYGLLAEAGDLWRSAHCLTQIARLAKKHRLWEECSAALDQQAVTFEELDRPDIAEPLHRKALHIAKKNSLFAQRKVSSANLAECLRRLGKFEGALKASNEALSYCDEVNDPQGYVSTLHNHYLIEHSLGKRSEAAKTLSRCEHLACRHKLPEELVRALMARGNAAWDRGHLTSANSLFSKAVKEASKKGFVRVANDARYNLAIILRHEGNSLSALREMAKVTEVASDGSDAMHRATLKALLLEDVGKLTDARKSWMASASVAQRIHAELNETYCRTRAALTSSMRRSTPKDRSALADKANALINAIYQENGKERAIQKRVEDAEVFSKEKGLNQYGVLAYQVGARRLSALKGNGALASAVQNSLASIITSFDGRDLLNASIEEHIRWLFGLELSVPVLRRQRRLAEKWLKANLGTIGTKSVIRRLLNGFLEAEKLRQDPARLIDRLAISRQA